MIHYKRRNLGGGRRLIQAEGIYKSEIINVAKYLKKIYEETLGTTKFHDYM
jgi:hypothetical protein